MSSVTQAAATIDDLRRVEGKAELIAGRIVHLMPTGYQPNLVAARIYRSLDDHAEATGLGVAFTDNMGFTVPEDSTFKRRSIMSTTHPATRTISTQACPILPSKRKIKPGPKA
jgi:Putative restriction endonuclease